MPVAIVSGYQTKTQQTMPTPASTINSHDRLACAPLLRVPVYTKYICELQLAAETRGDYGCYYYYREFRMKSLSTYWLLITWWLEDSLGVFVSNRWIFPSICVSGSQGIDV
jgi:hypothetical protein